MEKINSFTASGDNDNSLAMKTYDISSFKIAFAGAHLEDVAKDVQSEIRERTGAELEIVTSETADDGSLELIIGRTDRDISATAFDFATFEYNASVGIFCDGGKVQMLGIDRTTVKDSVEYFFANIMTDNSGKLMLPERGAMCEKIDRPAVGIPVKEDDSYVRVVTNNVLMLCLTDQWNRPVTEDRFSMLMGMYELIDADIVGLQECDGLWRTRCHIDEEMQAIGYSKANTTAASNAPVYYRTTRFSEVDAGGGRYDTSSLEGYYEPRGYGWVCLEEKTTGKKIVIINTHLVWGWPWGDVKIDGMSEMALAYRNVSAKQLAELSEKMKSTYPGATVMVMGDLNSYLGSEACKILDAAMYSSRDTAQTKVNMSYNSTCNLSKMPSSSDKPGVIDHIYYSKDSFLTAKRYEVVVSKYSYAYSDHVPVLVDFAFN